MTWYRDYKTYQHLCKQLIFETSEKRHVHDVLHSSNSPFDEHLEMYCAQKKIDLKAANEAVRHKIKQGNQNFSLRGDLKVDEQGMIKKKQKPESSKKIPKAFSRIYKMIAKKIHPDLFENMETTMDIIEKKEMFTSASTAMSNHEWGDLVEVANNLNIKPSGLDNINKELKTQINNLKTSTDKMKQAFKWKYHDCNDDEECMQNVIKMFLSQIYNVR